MALELEASLVLIDEREGRHSALRLGLQPLGVLGILLRGKVKGHLDEIRPLLDALRFQAGFYVSDRLYQRVLATAEEEQGLEERAPG